MTMNKEMLKLEVIASASDSENPKTAKISGIAYSGGEIMQWSGRMVVDLSGMEFAEQIPLMDSHENSTSSKLGEVTARVEDGKLLIDGSITSQSDEAKHIIADGKLSKWQLSIGANILARKFFEENEKVKVNGIEFTGPITVVSKSLLREVSVVAIGADKGASMEIAASLCMSELQVTHPINNGGFTMGENENAVNAANNTAENAVGRIDASQPVAGNDVNAEMIQEATIKAAAEAVKAERKRVAGIQEVCAGEFPEIQAKAISEDWDMDKVRAEVLKEIRAKRPAIGVNVNTGAKSVGKEEIECALCMRLGIDGNSLANEYSESTVEAASKMCDISLKEVVHESIKLSGGTTRNIGISDEDIRAAFSTVSLPGILGNVANKVMLKHFNGVNPVAYRLCSTGSLTNFKPSERFRMTDLGDLTPVAEGGEIKDGGITEEKAINQIDTYGKKFCLTRKMIINDDLDAFAKIPAMMGQKAARLVDKLFFARLLANPVQLDGKALFSAEHKNLSTGALSKTSLEAAIAMFESQVDADGEPIGASARKILVPTALKFAARDLVNSALVIATGSTDAVKPSYNSLYEDNMEVISSPYLTDANAWYLFGNPNEVDTFEIGFLNGKRTPTIQQGDTDFGTLGLWYRIFFDIGVREQDHRGVLKVTGK